MKILKIAFKNINSLQGEHAIDFQKEPFLSNSLFAITGPTGSGKTTILDVIALALFNEIPRFGRVSKSEIEGKGAILTKGQKEAYARVTYRCAQGEFTSEWTISTARTGNLRDYEMYISNELTGELLVDKKSEVPAKNEELIGLKYGQFVKSVMLAQGAFAEFLRVPKKERSAILEKITGMDIYRKIGIKVYEKFRSVKTTIEDFQKEIANWENQLLQEEELNNLKADQQNLKLNLNKTETQILDLKSKVEHKDRILKEKNNLNVLNEQEKVNKQAIQNFNLNEGKAFEEHKMVEPIQQKLYDWKRLSKEQAKLQTELKQTIAEHDKALKQKSAISNDILKLIKTQVDESDYQNALADFERKVLQLQNSYNTKVEYGKALKNEIAADIRPLNLSFSRDYSIVENDLIALKDDAQQFFIQNTFDFDLTEKSIQNEIEVKQNVLEKLQKAQNKAQKLLEIKGKIEQNKAEILQLDVLLQELPHKLESASSTLTIAEKDLANLELTLSNQKLMATLEEHRAHLKEEQPCPLCGSLEHPYASETPLKETSEFEHQIAQQKISVKQQNTVVSSLQTTLKLKQEQSDKLNSDTKELQTTEIKFKEEFHSAFDYALDTPWNEKILENKQAIALYKEAAKHQKQLQIAKIALPKLNDMLNVLNESKSLKEKLKHLYQDDIPIEQKVADLEQQWNKIQNNLSLIQAQKLKFEKDLDLNQKALSPLVVNLNSFIKELPFNNPSEAFNAILSYDKLQSLEKRREALMQKKTEIEINKKALNELLNNLLQKDSPQSLSELNENLSKSQLEVEEIKIKLEQHAHTLMSQEEFRNRIKELNEKIKKENKATRHWKILNDLIGDATGNKFNTFAQDLTLKQLLQLANKRLVMLSDRYLVANPEKSEDDSLVVIDKDMGGQRRSVKTLSGGETFVISLALALALSDLASFNVKIQSLFIDEGFGTLDPETLDQTLNTLEQLQDEGTKTIGIISHVSSLKERITTQIQVTPNGRGFSTLEVVG